MKRTRISVLAIASAPRPWGQPVSPEDRIRTARGAAVRPWAPPTCWSPPKISALAIRSGPTTSMATTAGGRRDARPHHPRGPTRCADRVFRRRGARFVHCRRRRGSFTASFRSTARAALRVSSSRRRRAVPTRRPPCAPMRMCAPSCRQAGLPRPLRSNRILPAAIPDAPLRVLLRYVAEGPDCPDWSEPASDRRTCPGPIRGCHPTQSCRHGRQSGRPALPARRDAASERAPRRSVGQVRHWRAGRNGRPSNYLCQAR